MTENVATKTDSPQVTPTPVTEANAPVKAVEAVPPADSHAENAKHNAAFAAMRKRAREAERKLAANQQTTPPPTPNEAQATPEVKHEAATAPAPVRAEVDVEAESEKAVVELGKDKELALVPGSIVDIITMVDSDPRLARLHAIDPTLAFREAKGLYLSKAGITTPPPIPKVTPSATGVKGASEDLAVLLNEIDNCHPGSKRFNELKRKLDAARRKG